MLLKILNLAALVLVIVMNGLANGLPINGKTTGELSALYPNLFVPAGFTFAIWGAIYVLLIGFGMVQFSDRYASLMPDLSMAFILSCVFNAGWIVLWHYEKVGLSVLVMLGLLVALLVMNQRLISHAEATWFRVTFGVYLGWICVATVANVTAWLVSLGVETSVSTAVYLTLALIVVAAGIAGSVAGVMANAWILVPVVWALYGIASRHFGQQPLLVATCGIAGLVLTGLFIRLLTR